MIIFGYDFTSTPRRTKPIVQAQCELVEDCLTWQAQTEFDSFAAFEQALAAPGPWIAGFDFPFAQSRQFIENIGWPRSWAEYISHAASMDRESFRAALEAYKAPRASGDKEHSRQFEAGSGAASPQKLYGVPVALMFHTGAPRLLYSGAAIPGLHHGDALRRCIEAYPGVLARALIGRTPYKNDQKAKQTTAQMDARLSMLQQLCGPMGRSRLGLKIAFPDHLAEDPSGDALDAALSAVQAAWAAIYVLDRPNALATVDPLEGWIADPDLFPLAHQAEDGAQ